MTFRAQAPQKGVAANPDGLGARLGAVASLVPFGSRVGDIGTDHGGLPRRLLATGRAAHCVATERFRSRLAAVERELPVAANLELRAGDGLAPLRPEDRLDVVTLSGIGTRTISRILSNPRRRELRIGRFVLQPQSEWTELRRDLRKLRLVIVDERLVEERGRFYLVVAAATGSVDLDVVQPTEIDSELIDEVGPCLIRSGDPAVRRYWTRRLRYAENLADRIGSGVDYALAKRKVDLARRILGLLDRDF